MTRAARVLAVLAIALAGCGPSAADDEATSAADADALGAGLVAVATVYPLAWLGDRIAPGAELTSLAAGGQDPHDVELSPGDREILERADVVLSLGDIGFQPQVEDAIDAAGGTVVAAADVVGEDALLPISHDADEHERDDHAEDDDHAEVDPHLWFDADLWAEVAVAAGEGFAAADPDRAEAYTEAASTVADDLTALAEEVAATLGDCDHDTVVVGHEAYAYLLEPHGLHQEGVSGAGSHADASPQRIAALSELIRDEGIPAVLTETVAGRADAEAVAAEAGVDLVEISSLDIVTDEQAEAGYPDLLRAQAAAVAQAAGCQA